MASVARRVWSETLTFLAVAFLIAFSYPAFVDPVPSSTQTLLNIVQWVSWIAFAADLIYGLSAAKSKKNYLKKEQEKIFLSFTQSITPN
jgi:voltage-gated potassium channel